MKSNRTFKPSEVEPIPADTDFKLSADGLTGSIVPRVDEEFPPTRSFDLDNLLRNGFSFEPVNDFIKAPVEDNMAIIEELNEQLNSNTND